MSHPRPALSHSTPDFGFMQTPHKYGLDMELGLPWTQNKCKQMEYSNRQFYQKIINKNIIARFAAVIIGPQRMQTSRTKTNAISRKGWRQCTDYERMH